MAEPILTKKRSHTPLPWRGEESGDGKRTVFYGTGEESEICEPVFEVEHDDVTHKGMKEVRANIKLLKAAPAMLEALEAITERYTSLVACGDCGNWDAEAEAPVIAARAAIKKATV